MPSEAGPKESKKIASKTVRSLLYGFFREKSKNLNCRICDSDQWALETYNGRPFFRYSAESFDSEYSSPEPLASPVEFVFTCQSCGQMVHFKNAIYHGWTNQLFDELGEAYERFIKFVDTVEGEAGREKLEGLEGFENVSRNMKVVHQTFFEGSDTAYDDFRNAIESINEFVDRHRSE